MSEEKKDQWCYLDAPELDRLDHACLIIRKAFDTPYLVGSCLKRADYRDVDVRLIMDDDEYDALFTGQGRQRANPLWSLLCASISEYLKRLTDLPVDFQFQRRTQANERWGSETRHPLGLYVDMQEPDTSVYDRALELVEEARPLGDAYEVDRERFMALCQALDS